MTHGLLSQEFERHTKVGETRQDSGRRGRWRQRSIFQETKNMLERWRCFRAQDRISFRSKFSPCLPILGKSLFWPMSGKTPEQPFFPDCSCQLKWERESVSVARCFARPLGAVGMRRVRLESQILIGNTGSNDLFHYTIMSSLMTCKYLANHKLLVYFYS